MDAGRALCHERGHDSIAVFAFDGERLKLLQHVASGGALPRFILLFEDHARLLAANEEVLKVPGAVFLAEVQREAD